MFKKCLVSYLVFAMFIIGIAPRVEAAFSPSEVLTLSQAERTQDTETIRTALENKVVAQRLSDLGYSAEEIASRLSELTDAQMHSFAQKLDDLKVGGDGLGIVIAILVIILLIVLILSISGRKVVVTK